MQRVRLVVAMAVGPGHNLEFVSDTIESVVAYTTPSRKFIVIDDSQQQAGDRLRLRFPDLEVLVTDRCMGRDAGLYISLSKTVEFACRHFEFDLLLKIDTDTLLIGEHPESQALDHFRAHPQCGLLGSHTFDCLGRPQQRAPHAYLLHEETCDAYHIMNPARADGIAFLRQVFTRARSNAYALGERCEGGGYFMSYPCAMTLFHENLLSNHTIAWSRMGEDQLFGMLTVAAGFKLGDFATGDLPVGTEWKNLPCAPADLLRRKKKIIHSVRAYSTLSEADIRQYFKARRPTV